jgi:hypothetical protein
MVVQAIQEAFECARLGGAVAWVVHLYEVAHVDDDEGGGQKKVLGVAAGFSCHDAARCGVQTSSGAFDWQRCVHPDSPK